MASIAWLSNDSNVAVPTFMAGNNVVGAEFWCRDRGWIENPNEFGGWNWNRGYVLDRVIIDGVKCRGAVRFDLKGRLKSNTLRDDVRDSLAVRQLIEQAQLAAVRRYRADITSKRSAEHGQSRDVWFDLFDNREGEFADVPVIDAKQIATDFGLQWSNRDAAKHGATQS